uniref:UDENN domain-containing protein n=1 Tax=Meloidogyne incognita TaxID=6306 RepID=A0A914KPJ2_MELIC
MMYPMWMPMHHTIWMLNHLWRNAILTLLDWRERNVENEPVQLFTFAFTDASSLHTFGYCRFTPRNNSVLCILSGFLWTSFFYKFLNHISTVTTKGAPVDVESLLINAYHMDIPSPGSTFSLTVCSNIGRFSDVIPNPSNLPTLQEDKSLLEFFNAVNERQMVQLYSSLKPVKIFVKELPNVHKICCEASKRTRSHLLKERRIVFISSKLSQLSSCVFGLAKLLNPFEWQNLFIPILPQDLTDMLMAPMPYLIGVPKQIFLKINKNELGDIVLTDLDEKMLSSPYQDKLPQEAYNYLWSRLKLSNDLFLSDSFAKTFLRTNAILFGNYNCGFTQDFDGIYTWDREIFLERERPSIRPYLETLIGKDGVQYFERFVQERLEALKNGIAVNDKFEKEVQSLDVRGLSKGIWSRPPELLQQTVSSIKENASDVIFALKDQFQSIKAYER